MKKRRIRVTLGAWMAIVAGLGLLACTATTFFMKPRESTRGHGPCERNLRKIDAARMSYAIAYGGDDNTLFTHAQVALFMKDATNCICPSAKGTNRTFHNSYAINVLTSDVIVALPGGPGTASEVRLALRYAKPIILYLGESGAIEGLEPGGLPVTRRLDDVQRFVEEELRRRALR